MEKEAFAVVAAREQQLWRGGGVEERTGITSGTLEVEEREFERILISAFTYDVGSLTERR